MRLEYRSKKPRCRAETPLPLLLPERGAEEGYEGTGGGGEAFLRDVAVTARLLLGTRLPAGGAEEGTLLRVSVCAAFPPPVLPADEGGGLILRVGSEEGLTGGALDRPTTPLALLRGEGDLCVPLPAPTPLLSAGGGTCL